MQGEYPVSKEIVAAFLGGALASYMCCKVIDINTSGKNTSIPSTITTSSNNNNNKRPPKEITDEFYSRCASFFGSPSFERIQDSFVIVVGLGELA